MILSLAFTLITSLLFINIPSDSVQQYESENLDKLLKKGVFERGIIRLDTCFTETEILKFNRIHTINAFLFCVVKGSTGNIQVLKANQIYGYVVGGNSYMSHYSNGDYFFIKLTKSGKAKLYERRPLPADNRFLFYLELPGFKDLLMICPEENDVSIVSKPGATSSTEGNDSMKMFFSSNKTEEKFKQFVSTYLGDCIRVKNSVESGYYSLNDLSTIIDMYNQCFEE